MQNQEIIKLLNIDARIRPVKLLPPSQSSSNQQYRLIKYFIDKRNLAHEVIAAGEQHEVCKQLSMLQKSNPFFIRLN